MKIRKNLFLISGGTYGTLGNTGIIKYNNGYIMVDSSRSSALKTIRENLKYWGIDENKITHVLLTHGHDDHAGSANYFQKLGAKVYVGKEDRYMLENGNFGKESPFKNHVLPSYSPDFTFDKDVVLNIGDLKIKVLKMPGHTNGSVIYLLKLDGDLVMFTGDMFYPDGKTGENPETGWEGDLNYSAIKLGKSFAKLWKMSLKPTVIIGGHGIPRVGMDAKDTIMLAYKYFLVTRH